MVEVRKEVYWVGAIDWDLRSFHGYSTPFGSTYNAYLILDKWPTLVDTVKEEFSDEMISRIKEIIDPSKIKYIVSNHTELDHSGSIDKLLKFCPEADVVCSPKGAEGLKRHFNKDWRFKVVETGDVLNTGKKNLKFFLTPMVHWPDSMVCYLEQDKMLLSNDAFGQHYASNERFADEASLDIIFKEAAKYYANIVMPYGESTVKALDKLECLEMEMICPSHGLIWRRKLDIDCIVSLYCKWSNYESEEKMLIVYDTMWHSTEMIAKKLYQLLDKEGVRVKLCNLALNDPSDIVADLMSTRVVALGCPILNNRIFPRMGGFAGYLKGLKPKNRFGFTFGSYGWSKAGFKELEDSLAESGIELIDEGKYFQYIPSKEELDSLGQLVPKIKDKLKSH